MKCFTAGACCLPDLRDHVIQDAVARVDCLPANVCAGARRSATEPWMPVATFDAERKFSEANDISDEPGWQFGVVTPPWDHVFWEPWTGAADQTIDLQLVWIEVATPGGGNMWRVASRQEIRAGANLRRLLCHRLRLWQQLFTRVLEAYDVTQSVDRDTLLASLGLDSLDSVALVLAIEEHVREDFGIVCEISDETADSWVRVGDIIDYITELVENEATAWNPSASA